MIRPVFYIEVMGTTGWKLSERGPYPSTDRDGCIAEADRRAAPGLFQYRVTTDQGQTVVHTTKAVQ